jgi:hypothetical protein
VIRLPAVTKVLLAIGTFTLVLLEKLTYSPD